MTDKISNVEPSVLPAENGNRNPLRPPFSSRVQALAFVLLVVFALALPFLITKSGAVSRRHAYQIMPVRFGPYSFVENEIYENDEDIDILFVGSSVMWHAMDVARVQEALSEELGRPARVRMFGHNFNDIDISYTKIRDVLEEKHVRMVVFSVFRERFTDGPSQTAFKFIRYSDYPDSTAGLPVSSKLSLYASSVLSAPLDLLSMVRENQPFESPHAKYLGATKEAVGIDRKEKSYRPFSPKVPEIAADAMIFSDTTRDEFRFEDTQMSLHQNHYLTRLDAMLRTRGIPLVMLHLPKYIERDSDKVLELFDWSTKYEKALPLIGLSPKKLFAGLSDEEIEMLYCDEDHFNKNGNEFFTEVTLPALTEVYKRYAKLNH